MCCPYYTGFKIIAKSLDNKVKLLGWVSKAATRWRYSTARINLYTVKYNCLYVFGKEAAKQFPLQRGKNILYQVLFSKNQQV